MMGHEDREYGGVGPTQIGSCGGERTMHLGALFSPADPLCSALAHGSDLGLGDTGLAASGWGERLQRKHPAM